MARSPFHVYLGWALPLVALALAHCGRHESPLERSLRRAALEYPRPVEGRLSVADRFAPWSRSPAAYLPGPALVADGKSKSVLRGSRPALNSSDPEELHRTGLL